eukprot:4042886-Pyramimonas_sp.AAC.1
MRRDVAVLPPVRLLSSKDCTSHRLPSLAPLVGGGRGPEGRHLNRRVSARAPAVSWNVHSGQ